MSVLVLGSLNADLVTFVDRFPAAGETVMGGDFTVHPGGKGLNQAAAASRFGAAVAMVGAVGKDEYGRFLQTQLDAEGIDRSGVGEVSEPTGRAIIEVDASGRNRIIVISGANSRLDVGRVTSNLKKLNPKVVLAQLETPLEITIEVFKLAKELGIFTILNPAPFQTLPSDLVPLVDLIVPNEHEARLLTGVEIATVEDAYVAAGLLMKKGYREVIITLGDRGAILKRLKFQRHFMPFSVAAIDTTAAGDAFCGTLAACVDRGMRTADAMRYASAAGAMATTMMGAVPSLPVYEDILNFVNTNGSIEGEAK